MKKYFNAHKILTLILLIAVAFLTIQLPVYGQTRVRTEIDIPDILGYQTLKCDFHMHTVFSDGEVWPTTRVEEAWREGLDAISITDHLEYLTHTKDIITNHNRPYEIAKPLADELGIILIKGCEITRSMPPGHFNAIFIKDAAAINKENWYDAIEEANRQGAFVFWNHPGWKAQAPDGAKWYDEHTQLYEKGFFKGIEIVNYYDYYPEVFQWALEKKLTLFGNSDIHAPIIYGYDIHQGAHRPMTLVFAEHKTAEAVRDALLNRRTAVYFEDKLIGEEKYLKPLFEKSIEIKNPRLVIRGKDKVFLQIYNKSDLTFALVADKDLQEVSYQKAITLHPEKTTLIELKGKSESQSGSQNIVLPFRVKNLVVSPQQSLIYPLEIEAKFEPENN